VAVDTRRSGVDLLAVRVVDALGAGPAVGLTDSVVAHLEIAALGVGLALDVAAAVDAHEALFAVLVEDALVRDRRVVDADAFFAAALTARAVLVRRALEGTEAELADLVVAAVFVVAAEELAERADPVDTRFTGLTVLGRHARGVLFGVDAALVDARLLAATIGVVSAERTALATVAVRIVRAVHVVFANLERDAHAVFAPNILVVTVLVEVALGDSVVGVAVVAGVEVVITAAAGAGERALGNAESFARADLVGKALTVVLAGSRRDAVAIILADHAVTVVVLEARSTFAARTLGEAVAVLGTALAVVTFRVVAARLGASVVDTYLARITRTAPTFVVAGIEV